MADYIDREGVLNIIQDRIKDIDKHEMSDVWRARKMMAIHLFREVQHLFAADVRENVRGEWKSKYVNISSAPITMVVECSECGVRRERLVGDVLNYCPNCGARMRGE